MTGLLSTQGQTQQDWSADYRLYSKERVQPGLIFAEVRKRLIKTLPKDAPLVVAFDDTRLRKTGTKIHGVQYTRDPLSPPFNVNLIRAQRFLQCSMAVPGNAGDARMVPIDYLHTPSAKKPRHDATEEERACFRKLQRETALPLVAATRLQEIRRQLDSSGEADRSIWAVVDGGFTNRNFMKGLPPGTTFVGRVRKDAKLYELPVPNRIGRRRVYGERAPTPEELRCDESVPWQQVEAFAAGKRHRFDIKVLSGLRWKPAGEDHTLRMIVIRPLRYQLRIGGRPLYRAPGFLLCNNTEAPLEEILQAYLWRWDIEVNFRDEKTLLGVGEAQVRNPESVELVPALAVSAYSALLCASIEVFGHGDISATQQRPKWRKETRRRASTQSLINYLREEIWASAIRFNGFVEKPRQNKKPLKLDDALAFAVFQTVA